MENVSKLEIQIRDFRAIKSADIVLNGITVVAGNNGCGKSTISKLLYTTIKTSLAFDKIVGEKLFDDLEMVKNYLMELSREVGYFISRINMGIKNKHENQYPDFIFNLFRTFNYDENIELREHEAKILSTIDILKEAYGKIPNQYKKGDAHNARFFRLERFFREEFYDFTKGSGEIDLSLVIENLKNTIKKKFEDAYKAVDKRPIRILDNTMTNFFHETVALKNVNIKELGAAITNREEKKLSSFLTVNKVLYIDTPMVIGVENIQATNVIHWKDLDHILKNFRGEKNQNQSISSLLNKEIINGESGFDEKRNVFIYKREDGFETNLFNCATGLKSFTTIRNFKN